MLTGFFAQVHFFLLMGCLMIRFLPSTSIFLDCLLLQPNHMPQSLSSGASDVHPAHHDSTESADPHLGEVTIMATLWTPDRGTCYQVSYIIGLLQVPGRTFMYLG